jgi:hypothetical protein
VVCAIQHVPHCLISSHTVCNHVFARTPQQHQHQSARRVHLHHRAPRVLHQKVLGPVRRVVQRKQLRLRRGEEGASVYRVAPPPPALLVYAEEELPWLCERTMRERNTSSPG